MMDMESFCVKLQEKDWEAWVCPAQAMNVLRLRYKGKDMLRTPASWEDLQREPFVYGIPLLFPAGRIPEGKWRLGDREVQMPVNEVLRQNHLHGLFYHAPFEVASQTGNSICGRHRSEDRKHFPADVELEIRCLLTETGMELRHCLKNRDSFPIPLEFALHTTFLEPETVSVQIGRKWKRNERFVSDGDFAETSELDERLKEGIVLPGERISGMYESCGHARIGEIVYTAEPPFDTWMIWNGDGKSGFLCVEPTCGIGAGVEKHPSRMLLPGESVTFVSRMAVHQ